MFLNLKNAKWVWPHVPILLALRDVSRRITEATMDYTMTPSLREVGDLIRIQCIHAQPLQIIPPFEQNIVKSKSHWHPNNSHSFETLVRTILQISNSHWLQWHRFVVTAVRRLRQRMMNGRLAWAVQ